NECLFVIFISFSLSVIERNPITDRVRMGGTEFDVGPTADRRRGRRPAGRRGSRRRDDAQARRAARCAIADPLLASPQQGAPGPRDRRRDPRPAVRRYVTARAGSTLAELVKRPRRAASPRAA